VFLNGKAGVHIENLWAPHCVLSPSWKYEKVEDGEELDGATEKLCNICSLASFRGRSNSSMICKDALEYGQLSAFQVYVPNEGLRLRESYGLGVYFLLVRKR
jgi:hypothetical protein